MSLIDTTFKKMAREILFQQVTLSGHGDSTLKALYCFLLSSCLKLNGICQVTQNSY